MRTHCLASLLLLLGSCPASAQPQSDAQGDPLPKGAVARLGSIRFVHEHSVQSLALSPDGQIVMSGCHNDRDGFVRLWSADGKELRRLCSASPDGSSVAAAVAALSPDGKIVAAADTGNLIFLWDTATGKERHRFLTGGSRANALAWSADSRRLAAGTAKNIFIWDATTGKELHRLRGHTHIVSGLAFAPDGKRLASASYDKTNRAWDLEAGKELCTFEGSPDSHNQCLVFAADGKTVAGPCNEPAGPGVTASSLRLWDAVSGKKIRDLQRGTFFCVALSPDGTLLAVGEWHHIRLLDPSSGKEIRKWFAHPGYVASIAFSGDGRTLASGGRDDHRLRLWDPATGKELRPTVGHVGAVRGVAFAPDGKQVASAGMDGTIRFWDPTSGRELRRAEDIGSPYWGVTSVAYAPDGKTLVSLEDGRTSFRLWDAASGKLLRRFGDTEVWHAPSLIFRTPAGDANVGRGSVVSPA